MVFVSLVLSSSTSSGNSPLSPLGRRYHSAPACPCKGLIQLSRSQTGSPFLENEPFPRQFACSPPRGGHLLHRKWFHHPLVSFPPPECLLTFSPGKDASFSAHRIATF